MFSPFGKSFQGREIFTKPTVINTTLKKFFIARIIAQKIIYIERSNKNQNNDKKII